MEDCPHSLREAKEHGVTLVQTLSQCREQLQITANVLTVLDRLVDSSAHMGSFMKSMATVATTDHTRRQADKANMREVEARFNILKHLAQHQLPLAVVLDGVDDMLRMRRHMDEQTEQVAARVEQLVKWMSDRLEQGEDAKWQFKTYRDNIELRRKVCIRCCML